MLVDSLEQLYNEKGLLATNPFHLLILALFIGESLRESYVLFWTELFGRENSNYASYTLVSLVAKGSQIHFMKEVGVEKNSAEKKSSSYI